MRSKSLILSCFVFLLIGITIVLAAEAATYSFDNVNVLYATSFVASPDSNQLKGSGTAGDWSSANQTWLQDLVTDSNPNITVVYGIVELSKSGAEPFREEFIKITGERGSRRFLLNSEQFEYYPDAGLRQIYSFFWSAKSLEGNNIVKNFAEPVDSVIFIRKLQPTGESTNFYLAFYTGADNATQAYQNMAFPIMYSMYKPIAVFGAANQTLNGPSELINNSNNEESTDNPSGEYNTSLKYNQTIAENNESGENNTYVMGNNETIGNDTIINDAVVNQTA